MRFGSYCLLLGLTSSAAAGCTDVITPPDGDEVPADECADERPPDAPARLLTRAEYRRTVRDLLGETEDPTRSFPPEAEVDGYPNNARSHLASPLFVEATISAAEDLAARAKERGLAELWPCAADGRPCAEEFVEGFGRRAFRRPLDEGEKLAFLQLYDRVAPSLGHEDGLASVLEAMLLSPQFLYRVESPKLAETELPSSTRAPLGSFELASRLSYFLWGTMPDDALLDAADSGALGTANDLEDQARRMLDDARAKEQVREFHRIWLDTDRLPGIVRDGAPAGFGLALEQSLLDFLDDAFWGEEGDLEHLFDSREVFANAELASVYGWSTGGPGFEAIDAGEERRGLLTQPALLSLLAHTSQSSPILRGVFLRDRLLCSPVPAPPPEVNNNPPDPDPNLTTRERFRVHTEDPGCASCHRLIDPVGFAFEGFDHLGRFRTEEGGLPIDTSGEMISSPDEELDGPFANIQEFSGRLPTSPAVLECLTRRWFTHALGRPALDEDECSVDGATAVAAASGASLREVVVAVVRSPAFRFRSAERDAEP